MNFAREELRLTVPEILALFANFWNLLKQWGDGRSNLGDPEGESTKSPLWSKFISFLGVGRVVSLKREIGSKGIVLSSSNGTVNSQRRGKSEVEQRFGWNNERLGEKWGAIPVDRKQRREEVTRILG